MKKKIIFGFFALALIVVNLVFSFQSNQCGMDVSQLLKLSQANAEWPYDDGGFLCYTVTTYTNTGGCAYYITGTYACSSGSQGGCTTGSFQNFIPCNSLEVINIYRNSSYHTCS